jgi:hypothetical protein
VVAILVPDGDRLHLGQRLPPLLDFMFKVDCSIPPEASQGRAAQNIAVTGGGQVQTFADDLSRGIRCDGALQLPLEAPLL